VKVVILGGGIAGLVSAYELQALGYECTVSGIPAKTRRTELDGARRRPVTFLDGTTQTCSWDPGPLSEFRAGPASVCSSHHAGLLQEARRAAGGGSEYDRSAFLQNDNANGGKPVVLRQAENDTRGHVSELLEKPSTRELSIRTSPKKTGSGC
jgi:monoamine oxidase